ncbi:MAG: flavodoxin family protein [Treponemataceae bacterium]|nr:flavodoxin family protein [Treponemataceae bacterium]
MAEKILLLNGSPKKERSGSLLLARAFVDGLTAHGDFETETVHISALNIKPCLGCLMCWAREDATCVITDDDIPAVRKKIEDADIVILCAPLFFFGLPGTVKVMMDRLLGMVNPYYGKPIPADGSSLHGFTKPHPGQRFVLISSCAWIEKEVVYASVFSQLDMILGKGGYLALTTPQMNAIVYHAGGRRLAKMQADYKKAGEEYAATGTVSEKTIAYLARPMFSDSVYQLFYEKMWRKPNGVYLLHGIDKESD